MGEIATNASGAIWWPNLELMQVEPPVAGEITRDALPWVRCASGNVYNFDNALGSQKILGTQNILGSQKLSCLRVFKKSPDSVNSFDNIYMFGPQPVVIFSFPCSSMPTLDSEKVKVFQHLLFLTKSKSYILLTLKQPFWGKHNTQRQWKKSNKLKCHQVK